MVREAVASVLAQREVACELIVVDDGSTDGTAEELTLIATTSAPQAGVAMRVLGTIENRGVAAARNTGVGAARADLIAFLDSDDLWAPDKLRHQVGLHARHIPTASSRKPARSGFATGRRMNPGLRHLKRAGDIFLDSLRTCLISPSAVIMRTELFRALGGFDETLTAAEDYDLWLRILRDHRGRPDRRAAGDPPRRPSGSTFGRGSRARSLSDSGADEAARASRDVR